MLDLMQDGIGVAFESPEDFVNICQPTFDKFFSLAAYPISSAEEITRAELGEIVVRERLVQCS